MAEPWRNLLSAVAIRLVTKTRRPHGRGRGSHDRPHGWWRPPTGPHLGDRLGRDGAARTCDLLGSARPRLVARPGDAPRQPARRRLLVRGAGRGLDLGVRVRPDDGVP